MPRSRCVEHGIKTLIYRNPLKLSGLLLMATALILFLLDRATLGLSNLLGRLFCGNLYLEPVNGVVGDVSCGFNADLYVAATLVGVFILGLVFYFLAGSGKA